MSLEINENDQTLDTSTIKIPSQKFKRTIAGFLTTVALYSGSILGAEKVSAAEIDNTSISSSVDYEDPNTVIDIPECYRFHIYGILNKEENEPITIKDLESITDEYFRINLREENASLEFLKYCKNATNLTIYGMIDDTTILQTIPDLPNVKKLFLATTVNDSDVGLETRDNLTVNSIDFSFLNKMTNLEELEIYGYSIEPGIIENLVSLKKLALYTNGNYDFDFSKLTFLDELSFRREQIYTIAKDLTLEEYKILVNSGVKIDFSDYERKKFYEINEKLDAIVSKLNITEESTDQDKLNEILIYVLDNLEYDQEIAKLLERKENPDHLAINFYEEGLLYGALEKETAICGNYAALVDALAKRVNLPTYYTVSENHAWNIVEVEGVAYYVDSTWLDGNSNYVMTTKEEVIDGTSQTVTTYLPITSQQLIKDNNTEELEWYMEDPTIYNDKEQYESHIACNIPTYINLVPLKEEKRFEILEPIKDYTQEELEDIETIDEKKFTISIGDRKWIIGGAIAVGIMSALGGAITMNKKKKHKKKERERYPKQRNRQLSDNPYDYGMFDDFESMYSNTNNKRY